jgi:hypothetical protein
MKTLIRILILSFYSQLLFAQHDSTNHGFKLENLNFNASYYGETVWYPGLKVGAEYIISEKKKDIIKTSKKRGEFTKIKTNQIIITGNMGYYWQPHNYSSLFINSAILYRHIINKGFQYNFGISPLGMNTFFFNETYEVSEDGEVKKVSMPTRFFYSPSLIMGLGHTMKNERLSAWFLNLHVTGLLPYNNAVNLLAALEFGFRFNIEKINN